MSPAQISNLRGKTVIVLRTLDGKVFISQLPEYMDEPKMFNHERYSEPNFESAMDILENNTYPKLELKLKGDQLWTEYRARYPLR